MRVVQPSSLFMLILIALGLPRMSLTGRRSKHERHDPLHVS